MRTAHHITSCLSAKQSKAKQTNDTGPPSPSTEAIDPAYLRPLATKNDSNHREVQEHAAHSFSAARSHNTLINSHSYIANLVMEDSEIYFEGELTRAAFATTLVVLLLIFAILWVARRRLLRAVLIVR